MPTARPQLLRAQYCRNLRSHAASAPLAPTTMVIAMITVNHDERGEHVGRRRADRWPLRVALLARRPTRPGRAHASRRRCGQAAVGPTTTSLAPSHSTMAGWCESRRIWWRSSASCSGPANGPCSPPPVEAYCMSW